jgi:hypothetical protein
MDKDLKWFKDVFDKFIEMGLNVSIDNLDLVIFSLAKPDTLKICYIDGKEKAYITGYYESSKSNLFSRKNTIFISSKPFNPTEIFEILVSKKWRIVKEL